LPDSHNDGNRNAGGENAILYGGGSGLVFQESSKAFGHLRCSSSGFVEGGCSSKPFAPSNLDTKYNDSPAAGVDPGQPVKIAEKRQLRPKTHYA
jgi:hypothetical protein